MKRLIQFVAGIVVPWFWVTAAYADTCAGVEIGTPGLHCSGNGNPIYAFMQFIINWIIKLLGAVAVLVIVSAPVTMVMSGGSPEGIKKAKSRLQNAIVGLILLSLSFFILKQIGVVQ